MGWVNVMGDGRDFTGNGPVITFSVLRPHKASARVIMKMFKAAAHMVGASPQRVNFAYGDEEDTGTVRLMLGQKNGLLRLVSTGGASSALMLRVPMWDGLNHDAPASKVTEAFWNAKTQTLVMSIPEELLGHPAKIVYRDDLGAKLGLA